MCKIGLQLYAVRDHFLTDIPGTLEKISKMGYTEVEGFWIYPCRAAELDKMLKDNGLSMCGWHIGLDHLSRDKYLAILEYHDRIGNKLLGINAGPEMLDSDDKIKALHDSLQEAQSLIAPYGFTLEYHNHWWEFQSKSGLYDKLVSGGDFAIQLDIGNALKGGAMAMDQLTKYSGRSKAAHFKPYSFEKGFDCTINDGYDSVSWSQIIPELKKQGVSHFTIEFESGDRQLELAQKNIDGLKSLL